MSINMQKKYVQYIVVRGDVPLPEGFMANQVGHAVAACLLSQMAWLKNNREVSEDIMGRINLSSSDAFIKNMDNLSAWSGSIFYKAVVRAKGPDELLKISSALAEDGIGYVQIKESGSVRIDKLAEIIKNEKGIDMYLTKRYPYFSPYTSETSYVKDGTIYLKRTDERSTLTVLGVMPLPEKDIPFVLRRLPLY